MTEDLTAALRGLASVFAHYPQRPILARCPHCGPPVRVADVDLFWLSVKLGNTVGDGSDVKAFLPLLFERLVTTGDLDPAIVLGKLTQQDWAAWPPPERLAVDTVIDAIWLALLSEFPSRTGAFTDPAEFLAAVATANVPVDRFLTVWDATPGEAADRHLADFVNGTAFSRRPAPAIHAWIAQKSLQDRLLRAYEHHHEDPEWADAFARAHDLASL